MGGVLGVCSGFSFITACELLYWFTLRILGDHFSNKNKNKISAETSETKESKKQEQNKGCDCEKLKSQIKDLQSRYAKLEDLQSRYAKLEAIINTKFDLFNTPLPVDRNKDLDNFEIPQN